MKQNLTENESPSDKIETTERLRPSGPVQFDSIVINELQLILAEKRTSLSAMRTGIAVFALPLSVLSVLIATSKYYDVIHVIHLFVPLILLNIALIFLGSYLVIRSILRLRHYDQLITKIKLKYSTISEFID